MVGRQNLLTQLRLDPLPPVSVHEFLAALLGDDPSLESLTPLLMPRTQGNPFFLEESVRTLVETGVLGGERGAYRLAQPLDPAGPRHGAGGVSSPYRPATEEEKRLLQAAAVIGPEVPFPLLEAIAELPQAALHRGLAHLQAAEFLYETRLFPERAYTFKHALTQQVAYQSLLTRTRQRYHNSCAGVGSAPRDGGDAARTAGASLHRGRPRSAGCGALAAGGRAQQCAFRLCGSGVPPRQGAGGAADAAGHPRRPWHELDMQIALAQALQVTKGSSAPEVGHAWARARELCEQVGTPRSSSGF